MQCSDGVQRATCSTTSTPPTTTTSGGGVDGGLIGGIVGVVAAIGIVALAIYLYRRNRPPKIRDSSLATGGATDATAAQP